MKLIYLASPYSHVSYAVREIRYIRACEEAAEILTEGHNVFSPIVHSHPLVPFGLPGTWDFWSKVDKDWIDRCDEVWVLKLDGWKKSVGVTAEIKYATEIGKPIKYIDDNRL